MKVIANAYRALLAYNFVNPDDPRYYLNGIAVQPHPKNGVLIVATDGHRLGVFHDPEGRCSENIILQLPKDLQSAILKEIRKAGRGGRTFGEVMPLTFNMTPGQTGEVRLTVGDVTMSATLVNGTFPDWARVVPKQRPEEAKKPYKDAMGDWVRPRPNPESAGQLTFNPQYVADFGKIKELGHAMPAALRITAGKDPGDPLFIDTGFPGFFGVLMPIRQGALPELAWFDDRLPQTEDKPAAIAA